MKSKEHQGKLTADAAAILHNVPVILKKEYYTSLQSFMIRSFVRFAEVVKQPGTFYAPKNCSESDTLFPTFSLQL